MEANMFCLAARGDTFYFEDKSFTASQQESLAKAAFDLYALRPELAKEDGKVVCCEYISHVKQTLGIDLNRVKITFVARFMEKQIGGF